MVQVWSGLVLEDERWRGQHGRGFSGSWEDIGGNDMIDFEAVAEEALFQLAFHGIELLVSRRVVCAFSPRC